MNPMMGNSTPKIIESVVGVMFVWHNDGVSQTGRACHVISGIDLVQMT